MKKSHILKTLFLGTAFVALQACSTLAPSPQWVQTQDRLTKAYNDKATAERGQGDLSNAKTALNLAASDWQQGRTEATTHQLTMANTYLDLAETRGQQGRMEQETARLSTQTQLASKDSTIAVMDQQLTDKSQALVISDQALREAQTQLNDYHMTQTDLGSTLVLQDVSFETGKSTLLSGGVNRLQALIRYLALSPTIHVRIEGYTDNVGKADYNQQLSLDRALSVKSDLIDGGIDAGRIETLGFGRDKPVATNKTIAGRQANRRVEITLLK